MIFSIEYFLIIIARTLWHECLKTRKHLKGKTKEDRGEGKFVYTKENEEEEDENIPVQDEFSNKSIGDD